MTECVVVLVVVLFCVWLPALWSSSVHGVILVTAVLFLCCQVLGPLLCYVCVLAWREAAWHKAGRMRMHVTIGRHTAQQGVTEPMTAARLGIMHALPCGMREHGSQAAQPLPNAGGHSHTAQVRSYGATCVLACLCCSHLSHTMRWCAVSTW